MCVVCSECSLNLVVGQVFVGACSVGFFSILYYKGTNVAGYVHCFYPSYYMIPIDCKITIFFLYLYSNWKVMVEAVQLLSNHQVDSLATASHSSATIKLWSHLRSQFILYSEQLQWIPPSSSKKYIKFHKYIYRKIAKLYKKCTPA